MNANPQAAAEQDRKSYRDLTTDHSRCRRANQGAGETQRGMRFVRPPELLAPRLKYATGQR
jgi:hypothetical protein